MAPETNEFERVEKTPPNTLLSKKDKAIVWASLRIVIKPVVPLLPKIAVAAGPALAALVLAVLHSQSGKADTDKKVDQVEVEAEATTKRAYKKLATPTRDLVKELAALEARVTAAEATSKAQSAVIESMGRDFVVEGQPAAARRKRVDAGLVKAVRENAARDSKELALRKAKPAPVIAAPPPELPPAPAKLAPIAAAPAVQQIPPDASPAKP
jgi:hypothetical protein